MPTVPFILLDDQLKGRARLYENPLEIICARNPTELEGALRKIQAHLDEGRFLAGYLSYEAGLLLESKLAGLVKDGDAPLCLMGVFENWSPDYPNVPDETVPRLNLSPAWSEADYVDRFNRVLDYIRAGDVYQINLTFPLTSAFKGSSLGLYDTLRARQPVHYGGVIALGEGPDIVTFSPELFFETENRQITMRPMKGTVKRLPDPDADRKLRDDMSKDSKSQAENLMIVDLLRNDLSRLAEKGSVQVPHLFALETYPTLHQMTSTVTAHLSDDITVTRLFKSLFPCGSVTGAPKIRAMEIIHELEVGPRGPYCGAIGYMDPDGQACFNVGIRTAMIDEGKLIYHVGSGVVLDSDGRAEYEECLLKAKVLSDIPSLVETFRWEAETGIRNRKHHFARLANSARMLGYPYDELALQKEVQKISGNNAQKCRLILSENGMLSVEHEDLIDIKTPVKIALSKHALSLGVQEFRHKVLARDFYESERRRVADKTGCQEIIFLNPEGEICEGSFTNIFVEIAGELITPHLSSGLLPGVQRAVMIERGDVRQAVLTIQDLQHADSVFVGNSLRGLMAAKFVDWELH